MKTHRSNNVSTTYTIVDEDNNKFDRLNLYYHILSGDTIHAPTTKIQTNVTGKNTFQPKRIIWS